MKSKKCTSFRVGWGQPDSWSPDWGLFALASWRRRQRSRWIEKQVVRWRNEPGVIEDEELLARVSKSCAERERVPMGRQWLLSVSLNQSAPTGSRPPEIEQNLSPPASLLNPFSS